MLKADDYDAAIIGVGRRCGQPDLLAYSVEKVISILAQEMSQEEAIEYFEFNVAGAWMGDETPIWVYPVEEEDYASA